MFSVVDLSVCIFGGLGNDCVILWSLMRGVESVIVLLLLDYFL